MEDDEFMESGSDGSGSDDGITDAETDLETWHPSSYPFTLPDSYKEKEEELPRIYFPPWASFLHKYAALILSLLLTGMVTIEMEMVELNGEVLESLWNKNDVTAMLLLSSLRVGVCCAAFPLFLAFEFVFRFCNGAYPFYVPLLSYQLRSQNLNPMLVGVWCALFGLSIVASLFTSSLALLTVPVGIRTVISVTYAIPIYVISVFFLKSVITVSRITSLLLFFAGVLLASLNSDRKMTTVGDDRIGGMICSFLSPTLFAVFLLGWKKLLPRPNQYTTQLCLSVMGGASFLILLPLLLLVSSIQPHRSSLMSPDSALVGLFMTSCTMSFLQFCIMAMLQAYSSPVLVLMSLFSGTLLHWLFGCANGCASDPLKIIGFILAMTSCIVFSLNVEYRFPNLEKFRLYPRGDFDQTVGELEEIDLDDMEDEDSLVFQYRPVLRT